MEKELRKDGSANSRAKKPPFTSSIWTEKALLKRLAKGREARAKFVESQISNGIAFQIRALRGREQWSQPRLAEEVETTQNQIYRLENPATTKPTISTLKRIAAAFDVALIVRFVPFSQLVDWVSGIPFVDRGLSTESLAVPSFSQEEKPSNYDDGIAEAPTLNQIVANLTPTFGEFPSTLEESPPYLQVAGHTLAQPTLNAAEYTTFITGARDWWAQPNASVLLQSYTQFAEPSQTANLLGEWRPQVWKHTLIGAATPIALEDFPILGIPKEKRITPQLIEFPEAA